MISLMVYSSMVIILRGYHTVGLLGTPLQKGQKYILAYTLTNVIQQLYLFTCDDKITMGQFAHVA